MSKVEWKVRPKKDVYDYSMPSKTDQSFLKETNVNSIMAKYRRTGEITHLAKRAPIYADVSKIGDLQEAFAKVEEARWAFEQLPARIREKLGNDPANLEGFISKPENREILLEFGLLTKKETAGTTVPAVSTEVQAPKAPRKKTTTVVEEDV